MARNDSQTHTAAGGLDTSSDPVLVSGTRASAITNFLIDQAGRNRNNVRLHDVLPSPTLAPSDGVHWYYQATVQNNVIGNPLFTDLLLFVNSGVLFIAIPPADPFTDVFSGVSPVINEFNPFYVGKRTRAAALNSELIFVQDGGLQPLRFFSQTTFGTHLFRAGFPPPPAGLIAALNLSGTGLTGTYQYVATVVDERGRESSPTPLFVNQALVNTVSPVNQGVQIQVQFNVDTNHNYFTKDVSAIYVYRDTLGTPNVFYRVAQIPNPGTGSSLVTAGAGNFISAGASGDTVDKSSDVTISANPIAPNQGENDNPNPASIVAVHKNRVFLNDVTNNATLQVSNLLSPQQWTSVPASPIIPTDGVRMSVGTDQGDPITALTTFGSVLGIFKRRGCFFLWGDDLTNFIIRPIHERGCVSPDTAVRCDNLLLYLSDDGVYAASYQEGDVVRKISREIEPTLLTYSTSDMEGAVATYIDNRYILYIGNTRYVYDFDAEGWTSFQFTGSAGATIDLHLPGVDPFTVVAGQGFSPLPTAGVYGSFNEQQGVPVM